LRMISSGVACGERCSLCDFSCRPSMVWSAAANSSANYSNLLHEALSEANSRRFFAFFKETGHLSFEKHSFFMWLRRSSAQSSNENCALSSDGYLGNPTFARPSSFGFLLKSLKHGRSFQ
jgi:hypothetical protein